MRKTSPGDIEEMARRAITDSLRSPTAPNPDRRYIYNDDPQAVFAGYAVPPNKRGNRRKISTFTIILVLFGFGIATVMYISNIIAVNRIALEVNELEAKYGKILNANEALRAEINRKSGWERIGKIATEQLDLKYAKEQPRWFSIDTEKLEEIGK